MKKKAEKQPPPDSALILPKRQGRPATAGRWITINPETGWLSVSKTWLEEAPWLMTGFAVQVLGSKAKARLVLSEHADGFSLKSDKNRSVLICQLPSRLEPYLKRTTRIEAKIADDKIVVQLA